MAFLGPFPHRQLSWTASGDLKRTNPSKTRESTEIHYLTRSTPVILDSSGRSDIFELLDQRSVPAARFSNDVKILHDHLVLKLDVKHALDYWTRMR